MISIKLPVAALFIAAGLSFFVVGINAEEVKTLGSLYQCAHDLRGRVWVINEREIFIQGFNYDGKGPAAWFHGQLKPSTGIKTSDPKSYVTLPFPDASCDRLKPKKSYKDDNITVILPRSIKDFSTIGVFCYEFCHNFGHVIIPETLNVPPAPEGLLKPEECPKPGYKGCDSPRNGNIKPDCKAGASHPGMMMIPGNNGAARLTFIAGWFIFSLFLTFRKQ